MLQKAFRALRKKWADKNVLERDLVEADYTYIFSFLKVRTLKDQYEDGIKEFCTTYLALHNSLVNGSFATLSDEPAGAEQGFPRVAADRTLAWLNKGLTETFSSDAFVEFFFEDLAELVYKQAGTMPSVFNMGIQLPSDDAITETLLHLPVGYKEVLMRLQYDIGEAACTSLFYYAVDNTDKLGGPGSMLRLVIDMIESQLFNTQAIALGKGFNRVEKADGTATTTVAYMTDILCVELGPYPINMAFSPILQHILYAESLRQDTTCLDKFLAHCVSDKGFSVHPIHRMGLLTMISVFIFNSIASIPVQRCEGLFCRSQIADERVYTQYSVPTLRRILDCVCTLDFDHHVVLVFSAASELIAQHGNAVMCHNDRHTLRALLTTEETDMRALLQDDEDPLCYERLLGACSTA